MAESLAILSGVIRVIHPELYQMGLTSIAALGQMANLQDIISIWTSIFNGILVISNRETPIHRDNLSHPEWYNLLATIGPYRSAIFELPGVGIRFRYNSGTVIGLSGRLLRHVVSESDGERVCIAYYMRDNVQRRLEAKFASWNSWDKY
jgi:hypothetical protein